MISPAQVEYKYEQSDGDVRLMLAVRNGSSSAFEEVMGRYAGQVLALLHLRTGNRHQAEDLTQEVFLRVFRARKAYKPTARFTTWLSVIVRNVLSNAKRDQARRREKNLADVVCTHRLADLAHRGIDKSPTSHAERAELRSMVRQSLDRLSSRERQAVVLQRYEQMKYEQIAETMGTSPKAVKALLFRARGRLRGQLAPYLLGEC